MKLLDGNGDGLLDVAVPWETGSEVRVYLNPGPARVAAAWPRVAVGSVKGPEDALLADLDADGFADVVSATEGSDVPGGHGVFVHWAPASRSGYADPAQWQTARIPATEGGQWIQAAAFQVDGRSGPDLVVGSIEELARVVLLIAPAEPRALDRWSLHEIYRGGQRVMSLEPHDFDGDGDRDLLLSLIGAEPGLGWLENPGEGPRQTGPWTLHPISVGGAGFAAVGDVDGDGIDDVAAPQGEGIVWYRGLGRDGLGWEPHQIEAPRDWGTAKGAAIADVNGDGRNDVALTRTWNPPAVLWTRLLGRERWGVAWLENGGDPSLQSWQLHDVSGPLGIKFDRLVLADLDGDGDLDALTTEEKVGGGRGLGVVWYENPGRSERGRAKVQSRPSASSTR